MPKRKISQQGKCSQKSNNQGYMNIYRYNVDKSKYRAKKTVVDGITFASKKEAERYIQLRFLEKQGTIKGLQRQVKFVLIPKQVDKRTKKTIERECAYYADFVYYMHGEKIVEDVKGIRTDVYKLKRKLMLWVHGIQITEV